jgi:hypothetical protein
VAPAIDLHLELEGDDALDDLERALLRARATELSEVRRRNIRLTAGYGDATTRDVMDDEGTRPNVATTRSAGCSRRSGGPGTAASRLAPWTR